MPNARPAKLRGGVSSSYVTSDPLLLPRVEAFARSSAGGGLNALRDVDACAQYLRSQYRQYARKPVNPFRKAVERAMAEARARGRCDDGNGDDGNGDDEKFSRMDGEGSSDHEDSDDSETSTSEATSSDGTSDENGAIERDENGMDGGDEAATTAAFAAPEVVAAAAQRALKLEAEAKASASGSKAVKEEESAHERAVRAVAEAKSRGHEVKLNERGMKIERLEKSKDKKRGKKGKGHRRKRKGDRDSDSESLDEDEFGRTTSAKAFAQMTSPRSVKLSDLGGIEDSLKDIKELILCPLMHPELYAWLGVDPPRGVLLHGPPGCGKTTLAHAIAQEAKVPFFSIAATEIVSGMSGESEAKIRELFQSAAAHAPSLIFIDEIDAIVPKRESAQREMERRIVAQLLASMDDLQSTFDGTDEVDRLARCRRHVTVIGATNRPDGMDAALRRAGRFDREIMLGIPDEAARERI